MIADLRGSGAPRRRAATRGGADREGDHGNVRDGDDAHGTDEEKAKEFLLKSFVEPYKELEVISPAQAEKMLKKIGEELPKELVVSISSGSTLALESDPRPAVLQIGKQLTAALSKLQ